MAGYGPSGGAGAWCHGGGPGGAAPDDRDGGVGAAVEAREEIDGVFGDGGRG